MRVCRVSFVLVSMAIAAACGLSPQPLPPGLSPDSGVGTTPPPKQDYDAGGDFSSIDASKGADDSSTAPSIGDGGDSEDAPHDGAADAPGDGSNDAG